MTFRYVENGAPASGVFTSFRGEGEFDPRRPEEARLKLEFDIDSIQLADSLRSEFVKTDAWFDVETYETAEYTLKSLEKTGENRFRAVGALRIKNRTRDLVSEITLDLSRTTARARGSVSFDRIDFRLGDTLNLLVDIERQISVEFDLVASQK